MDDTRSIPGETGAIDGASKSDSGYKLAQVPTQAAGCEGADRKPLAKLPKGYLDTLQEEEEEEKGVQGAPRPSGGASGTRQVDEFAGPIRLNTSARLSLSRRYSKSEARGSHWSKDNCGRVWNRTALPGLAVSSHEPGIHRDIRVLAA